jgi:hypothetical protein
MCIKVDKARPGKIGSEKKLFTIELPPHKQQDAQLNRKGKYLTTGCHDINWRLT